MLYGDRSQVDFACTAVILRNCLLNTGFSDDHRLDVQARHELDIVHGKDIGGVNHRQRQRGANSGQREDRILLRYFLRDEAQH